jgi:arylsulfatase A-like enzyme
MAEAKPRRALVMIWDGMRPDLIGPDLTPNLWALVQRGVWLRNSHAVFPTVTRVNSASLSTGTLPGRHGIVGDHRSLYRMIDARGGRLLPVETVADRVHAAGGRTVVVSSGTPGSAFLCHPRVRECSGDRTYNPAIMLPEGAEQELTARFGPIPAGTVPNSEQNDYFCRVVTDYVLPELDPDLLLYWHNDPDKSQHHRGFGSPEGLRSIGDADTNFGRVCAALADRGELEQTVVAVVSDHGYAALAPSVQAVGPFVAAGLGDELERGRILLSRNGFVLLINVPDGDQSLIRQVAEVCQSWEHGGAVFSGARDSLPLPGTLPLELAGSGGEYAPDVLCALAWSDERNEHGHQGRSAGLDSSYLASHGGLSPWEINNTFVLAGPGLKAGLEHRQPAGNLDLAPTLLHLLGLERPASHEGRVLREALLDGPAPESLGVAVDEVSAERGGFRQGVRFSTVEGVRYLDQGWARREPGFGLIQLD